MHWVLSRPARAGHFCLFSLSDTRRVIFLLACELGPSHQAAPRSARSQHVGVASCLACLEGTAVCTVSMPQHRH
eukprot:s99_g5.t1